MQVLSNITMDLATPGFAPVLEGVQGDTARAVCLHLTENGKAWDIPKDVEVILRYRNENGRGGMFDTLPEGEAAYTISGNQLQLSLPAQVWGAPGTTRVQAVLLQGQQQLTVFAFELLCQSTHTGEPAEEYVNVATWLKEHGIRPIRGVDYWTEEDIAHMQGYIDTQLGVIENGTY